MSHSQQDLINALMAAPRFGYRLSPHMYSSLLRHRPPEPPQPPTTEIVRATSPAPPAAVEDKEPEADLPQVPVWLLPADISVWRGRWFWRLVGSLAAETLAAECA